LSECLVLGAMYTFARGGLQKSSASARPKAAEEFSFFPPVSDPQSPQSNSHLAPFALDPTFALDRCSISQCVGVDVARGRKGGDKLDTSQRNKKKREATRKELNTKLR
jgi:hypothetical protein